MLRLVVAVGFGVVACGAALALHLHDCAAGHDHGHCVVCLQAVHGCYLADGPDCEPERAVVSPARLSVPHEWVASSIDSPSSLSPRAPPEPTLFVVLA